MRLSSSKKCISSELSTGSRQDNSLGVLTKKFVALIQRAEDRCIDLNDAVNVCCTQELNVQKRRIYDITNVLEGIGLIQKTHKNKIQWVGSTDTSEGSFISESAALNRELETLQQDEKSLDLWISQMQESMNQLTKDPMYAKFAFITFDDIRKVGAEEGSESLLAIRAPPGATLEAPDPEQASESEREKYQLDIESKAGEIIVYMVPTRPGEDSERVVSTNATMLSELVSEELKGFANSEASRRREGPSDLFP